MAIALFALSTLPHPLQALARGFQPLALLARPRDGCTHQRRAAPPPNLHAEAGHPGVAASPAPAGGHTGSSAHPRPLRGNWPFTVQPRAPQPAPGAAHQPPEPAHRAELRASLPAPGRSRAHCAAPACGTAASRHLPSRGSLRRIIGSGTGRIVLAGRMADVCAELDRLVALETTQARPH